MKECCVYWRYKNSADINLEYTKATRMSYAIEQVLEYIAEANQLDLEDIYICHVEVVK